MWLILMYGLFESRNVNIWGDFSVKRRCVYRNLIEIFGFIMSLIKMFSFIFVILFIIWNLVEWVRRKVF